MSPIEDGVEAQNDILDRVLVKVGAAHVVNVLLVSHMRWKIMTLNHRTKLQLSRHLGILHKSSPKLGEPT